MSEDRQGPATVWKVQTVPKSHSLKGNHSEIPNSSQWHNAKNIKNIRKSAAICSTGQFVQQLAAQEFGKHPDVRKLNILADKNIEKIVGVASRWEEIEGFSKGVSLAEIAKNDFNLNVTLYASPERETDHVDLAATWAEIRTIETELWNVDEENARCLTEIGIEVPTMGGGPHDR